MSHEHPYEDQPDPILRAALRAAVPEPPLENVDWNALHARIQTHAQPLLLQQRKSLLHLLGSWSHRGSVLAAAAAALMAVVLVGTTIVSAESGSGDGYRTVEEELAYALPVAARTLLGSAGEPETMLDAVLFYDAEEW